MDQVSSGTPRRVLVCVYGSGNILAGIASVLWSVAKRGDAQPVEVTTLVHPPAVSADAVTINTAVVGRIVEAFGWQAPIVLSSDDAAEILGPGDRFASYSKTLERFRRRVGLDRVDEIHFAHDIVGPVPELAMNAFPDAERITFGDALGSTYDKEYCLALARGESMEQARKSAGLDGELVRPRKRVLRVLREALLGAPRPLHADSANLILPMDQTGHVLDKIPYSVVPKDEVLQIIAQVRRHLPALVEFAQSVLAESAGHLGFLLLENFSESEMMSFDDELKMYQTVVRQQMPIGSTVLVKSHPLSAAPLGERLAVDLSPDYKVRLVPGELNRYPVELWSELATRCTVLSVFSYCGISLAFLYGTPTIAPDDEFIERFFPQHAWDRTKEQANLWRGQLHNLRSWDGKSVLWKGSE